MADELVVVADELVVVADELVVVADAPSVYLYIWMEYIMIGTLQ